MESGGNKRFDKTDEKKRKQKEKILKSKTPPHCSLMHPHMKGARRRQLQSPGAKVVEIKPAGACSDATYGPLNEIKNPETFEARSDGCSSWNRALTSLRCRNARLTFTGRKMLVR